MDMATIRYAEGSDAHDLNDAIGGYTPYEH